MQALVDAVRLCCGVLDSGDEDLGLRKRFGEFGDERYRAAHPHIDRIGTPGLPERRPRGVIDCAAGLDGVGLSLLAACDADLCAPRGMLLQMESQRVQVR